MPHPQWFTRLLLISGAHPTMRAHLDFAVCFTTPTVSLGIDLRTGNILDQSRSVRCSLAATDDVFRELAQGGITLQRAYVTGQISLQGNAESLLKLARLFEACAAEERVLN